MTSLIYAYHLLLLFDRPNEPVFMPKGHNQTLLKVPLDYLPKEYQPIALKIQNDFARVSNNMLTIKPIKIPDLSLVMKIKRAQTYSTSQHEEISNHLITLFMEMPTIEDMLSLAVYCRDRVNQMLFFTTYTTAILHRLDTRHLRIPQLYQTFPSFFIPNSFFRQAREKLALAPQDSHIIEVPLDTDSSENPEQQLAFFREDVGTNIFHWAWHLLFPIGGPRLGYGKDRRGEIFFYMHHQIMSRYNTERLANKLALTKPLDNLREPIAEGYFPKLDRSTLGVGWPGRSANQSLSDVERSWDNFNLSVSSIETWKKRFSESIKTGSMINSQGQKVPLNATNGVNILGNAIDANAFGINKNYYGYLHGSGHVITSFIHDPRGDLKELASVMNPTSTAVRDPLFFRWHEYVDDLFYSFIDTLPAYTAQQLSFRGVKVNSISVHTVNKHASEPNVLHTHWAKSDIDLSSGLDFSPRAPIFARIQHLDHQDFVYHINVYNSNGFKLKATVRIFIGPQYDQNGQRLTFNQQKRLMIELDKFSVKLKKGKNQIYRQSAETPVTVSYESVFVDAAANKTEPSDGPIYCGCGWPHHMLLPRGHANGYPMDLFVMLSDYRLDGVEQEIPQSCEKGHTLCGLRSEFKYPDKFPMGYPFDRVANSGVKYLTDFLTSNMAVRTVKVKFQDVIKSRRS